MADSTVLVLVPESGDGIQTLKSGLMEAADLYAINKADRPGAEKLRQELEVTLGIRRGHAYRHVPAHHGASAGRREPRPDVTGWEPPVLLTTASRGEGVPDLLAALDRHHEWLAASGELERRRRARLAARTREVVDRAARRWIWQETRAERLLGERLDEVVEGRLSPYDLAAEILDGLREGERV
jgi:LAO/AO transport system kinase